MRAKPIENPLAVPEEGGGGKDCFKIKLYCQPSTLSMIL